MAVEISLSDTYAVEACVARKIHSLKSLSANTGQKIVNINQTF